MAAILFGAAAPACKGLLAELTSLQLTGLLYLGAAAGVTPLFVGRSHRAHLRASSRNVKLLATAVVAGGMAGPILLLEGLRRASAASVSLYLSLELVATAVLGALFFRDHLTRASALGALASLVGAALLSSEGGAAGALAAGLVAGACLCWGLDNNCTALIDQFTVAQIVLAKGLVAGTVSLGLGIMLGGLPAPLSAVLGAFGVGLLSYGLSMTLYIQAAQGMGATRSQALFCTSPVFGVLVSVLALGERLNAFQLVAGACFAGAITALMLESHAHAHRHEPTAHAHWHRHDDGHHAHEHPDGEAANRPRHWHWHRHDAATHDHPHWPDLHHRHTHC